MFSGRLAHTSLHSFCRFLGPICFDLYKLGVLQLQTNTQVFEDGRHTTVLVQLGKDIGNICLSKGYGGFVLVRTSAQTRRERVQGHVHTTRHIGYLTYGLTRTFTHSGHGTVLLLYSVTTCFRRCTTRGRNRVFLQTRVPSDLLGFNRKRRGNNSDTTMNHGPTRGVGRLRFNGLTYMEQKDGISYRGLGSPFYRRVNHGKQVGTTTSGGYTTTTYTHKRATYTLGIISTRGHVVVTRLGNCSGVKVVRVRLWVVGTFGRHPTRLTTGFKQFGERFLVTSFDLRLGNFNGRGLVFRVFTHNFSCTLRVLFTRNNS